MKRRPNINHAYKGRTFSVFMPPSDLIHYPVGATCIYTAKQPGICTDYEQQSSIYTMAMRKGGRFHYEQGVILMLPDTKLDVFRLTVTKTAPPVEHYKPANAICCAPPRVLPRLKKGITCVYDHSAFSKDRKGNPQIKVLQGASECGGKVEQQRGFYIDLLRGINYPVQVVTVKKQGRPYKFNSKNAVIFQEFM